MTHTIQTKLNNKLLCLLCYSFYCLLLSSLNAAAENSMTTENIEHTDTLKIVRNIQYSEAAGEKGYGDLFLPQDVESPRTVLLIHGGAWKHMTRQRVQQVAAFIAEQGYAVFNVSYRLLPQAPYPACEVDCIDAAKFLLEGEHPAIQALDRSQIVVGGLSAGGHLALVTGLKLPTEQIAGILDICGPTELHAPELEGLMRSSGLAKDEPNKMEIFKAASPTLLAAEKESLPPLLVLHCQQDGIVNIKQAYRIMDVWNQAGANLQAFLYEGNPKGGHNIWRTGKSEPDLHYKLEHQIISFLNSFFQK
ncbi:alpha/beta hydrolase [Coraliomargarita algicola]|uniref:Alpha/beta hydrolase n=1 Tax=Coraliomargarita algicola TaxID=3092156 RepID=A0ABZ0RMS0_9BACT|nr:alpha/beta hydrolase [Coraliomargarita sp. J2-16]WPJ96723.1 alpha/beta hydrolase [Coraliomargarita sp. J2-16]